MVMPVTMSITVVMTTWGMRMFAIVRITSPWYFVGSYCAQSTGTYCTSKMPESLANIFAFFFAMMVNGFGDSGGCYSSFGQVPIAMRIAMFLMVVIPVVVSVFWMASRVMAMPAMVTTVMMASVMMITVSSGYFPSWVRHIAVWIVLSWIIGVHCSAVGGRWRCAFPKATNWTTDKFKIRWRWPILLIRSPNNPSLNCGHFLAIPWYHSPLD